MVVNTKSRHIIQAPPGTDPSTIKPKLHKKSTLVPLKHRMFFGGRTFSYIVPNDGFEYFLYQRNQKPGILASGLQERLENEELVVRDVLDFGEKEISHKKKKKMVKKEFKEKDKEIAAFTEELTVRDVFDFGEEEMPRKKEKKLSQKVQEKDQEIVVLTKQIQVIYKENEILRKMLHAPVDGGKKMLSACGICVIHCGVSGCLHLLTPVMLKNLEEQVRKARKEQLKRFQEEVGNKKFH